MLQEVIVINPDIEPERKLEKPKKALPILPTAAEIVVATEIAQKKALNSLDNIYKTYTDVDNNRAKIQAWILEANLEALTDFPSAALKIICAASPRIIANAPEGSYGRKPGDLLKNKVVGEINKDKFLTARKTRLGNLNNLINAIFPNAVCPTPPVEQK